MAKKIISEFGWMPFKLLPVQKKILREIRNHKGVVILSPRLHSRLMGKNTFFREFQKIIKKGIVYHGR